MLKTSSNGTQATTAPVAKFTQRTTAETLEELNRPIDPRHFKTRKQGNTTLTYVPWATLARHLHHRAPGWNWEIQNVNEIGGSVVVTGRLTIPTTDGLLHYSAVASEPLESKSQAPAAEVAASSCLRRAAALAGLGLELWG
jgi:IS4 transposase